MSNIAMGQKGYDFLHWIHLKSHNCLGPYKIQTLTMDHIHSKTQYSISHSYVNSIDQRDKNQNFCNRRNTYTAIDPLTGGGETGNESTVRVC